MTADLMFYWLQEYPTTEPQMYAAFQEHVKASTIALDIGAWAGATTIFLAKLAKHVVAIEPSVTAFELLVNNVNANTDSRCRVSALNAALGDRSARAFFTDAGSRMDHPLTIIIFHGVHAWSKFTRTFPEIGKPTYFIDADAPSAKTSLLDVMRDVVRTLKQLPDHWKVRVESRGVHVLLVDPRKEQFARALGALRSGIVEGHPDLMDQIQILDPPDEPLQSIHRDRYGRQALAITWADTVSVEGLLAVRPELAGVGFVKIDAEGAEAEIVPRMRSLFLSARPVLWISVHRFILGDAAVKQLLQDLASIFPHLYDSRGMPVRSTNRTRYRRVEDVLCTWVDKRPNW